MVVAGSVVPPHASFMQLPERDQIGGKALTVSYVSYTEYFLCGSFSAFIGARDRYHNINSAVTFSLPAHTKSPGSAVRKLVKREISLNICMVEAESSIVEFLRG
jgi:hypothetical protein